MSIKGTFDRRVVRGEVKVEADCRRHLERLEEPAANELWVGLCGRDRSSEDSMFQVRKRIDVGLSLFLSFLK